MATYPRKSFIFLIMMVALLPLVISGHYPKIFITPQEPELKEGDLIPLFANKVFPRAPSTCEPYSYHELPFCPPGEPMLDRKKSPEEIIFGDCFTKTRYELKFKVNTVEKALCEKTLTKDEVNKFREAVKDESEYDMFYNKILFRGNVGFVERWGGSVNSKPMYYLVKHIDFYPQYSENQVTNIDSVNNFNSTVDITEDAEIRVNFTYSVFWKEFKMTPIKCTSKNRTAMIKEWWNLEPKDGISMITELTFWFLNLFLFLGLVLLFIYLKIWPPPSRQNPRQEGLRPEYPWLLAPALGIGIQQLVMISFLFIADFNDIQYPCYLGPLTTQLLIYCLLCLYYGYKGAQQPQHAALAWKKELLMLGRVPTVYKVADWIFGPDRWLILDALLAVLCYLCKHYGFMSAQQPRHAKLEWIKELLMLATVPVVYKVVKWIFEPANWLTTCALLHLLWNAANHFLSMVVSHAYSLQIQKHLKNRRLPRLMTTPWQIFLGGLLPFLLIFRNLNKIFASFLLLKVCGVFSTMLSSFIIVIVTTASLGAGFTIYGMYLHGGNLNWWWRSVFRGGSTAIFMFAYGIYFYLTVGELKVKNLYMFLFYNAFLCCVFFVALGATGFYGSQLGSYIYNHWVLASGNR